MLKETINKKPLVTCASPGVVNSLYSSTVTKHKGSASFSFTRTKRSMCRPTDTIRREVRAFAYFLRHAQSTSGAKPT